MMDPSSSSNKENADESNDLSWLDASPVFKKLPSKITAKNRTELAKSLTGDYLRNVFKNEIDPDVTWSKRLLTTAGLTRLKKRGNARTASVELSVKVSAPPSRSRMVDSWFF